MLEAMIMAGIGGFCGSGCRYLTGLFAKRVFGSSYPAGTFIANVVGCFIIGIFVGLYGHHEMSHLCNALLITGFCGGYTTFSSFCHDSYKLIGSRQWGKLLLYVVPSVALGLLFVYLGMKCV